MTTCEQDSIEMEDSSKDVNKNILFTDATPMEHQVAGHSFQNTLSLGMLRNKDGYVLKSMPKTERSKREIEFYEELQKSTDPVILELKQFVPKYFGTTTLTINQKEMDWLVLKDLTRGYAEPCVMDIKIGRQTWDPQASEEKKRTEMSKYVGTKQTYAFCIPGFQVYQLTQGNLVKYDKAYGNSLDKVTVKDAFKLFLNADVEFSRCLVLEILGRLWKILRWFRHQTKYKIYGSSLLIVYDAKKLRMNVRHDCQVRDNCENATIGRQLSLRIPAGPLTPGFGNDQMIIDNKKSPSGSRNHSPTPATPTSPFHKTTEDWHTLFDKVCKTHSLEHNYEKDLQSMKTNYNVVLEDLIQRQEPNKEIWVNIKMIDFAHVFKSNNELDENYLEGIENLVNIFEKFLFDANS